ncbi:hypothetical protein F5144DRAFT_561497, partial [Chaetomium tenue]
MNGMQAFALLSTSPSSYSRAFLTRLLNRGSTPSSDAEPTHPALSGAGSSSKSDLLRPGLVANTHANTAATRPGSAACLSDSEEEEEEEEDEDDGEMDMLDLFSARGDREFDRMTGLTSAESAVGFDDDDDDDEEEEDSSEDEDREGEEEEEEEEEDEEDDILLLGH